MRLENVSKTFKNAKAPAVKGVSLEVADGEFLVLLGPSGCGKTTTLRVVAGLEKPTAGSVYIGGALMDDVLPKDRDIAMVFQSYALYPHMTVHDNLAFPLKMRKYPREQIEEQIGKTAEILEMKDLLQRRPKELSGGQRQRVALGRAIVRNPKVFLMDEPLSNLDAKLRVQTRVELKNLQKRIGTTTIYVTHDQAEAMTLADRVAVMKEGVVQQVGPPTEIYAHPANKFVAGFIGSPAMNFIEGGVVAREGGTYFDAGSFQFPIEEGVARGAAGRTGRRAVYGIRAEDVELAPSTGQGVVEFSVFGSELMGAEQFVHGRRGDQSIVARAPMELKADIGASVWMNLSSRKAHLFDAETEEALV